MTGAPYDSMEVSDLRDPFHIIQTTPATLQRPRGPTIISLFDIVATSLKPEEGGRYVKMNIHAFH